MLNKIIYIASPYTLGDQGGNVHVQIEAAHRIMDMGHIPLAPVLSHFLHICRPRPYEDWMRCCKALVAKADIVLRLPGQSPGADEEIQVAKEHDIPIARDWGGLFKLLEEMDA